MWPFRRQRHDVVLETIPDQRFRLFGGRQHLAAMPYPLPKDMDEINRLDFQHFLLRTGLRGNYAAPLGQPTDILDVGCGSGRWAMEMAALFPNARIVGVDLVPPPSDGSSLGQGLDARPNNYLFSVGNILEGLPFPDGSFDFVHQRLLITAISRDRWPAVIQELRRVVRPGGWVELAECGQARDGGPGYMGLWQSWIDFLARRDVDFTLGRHIGQMLTNGGLANVQRRVLNFPMGDWGAALAAPRQPIVWLSARHCARASSRRTSCPPNAMTRSMHAPSRSSRSARDAASCRSTSPVANGYRPAHARANAWRWASATRISGSRWRASSPEAKSSPKR